MKKNSVYIIAAVDDKFGIGKAGKLPWTLKQDLQFFQKTTTKTDSVTKANMVIMGRKTWESIPPERRPLPGRRNVVLTSHADFKAPGIYVFESLKDAFEAADEFIDSIFVIGGGQVFEEAIRARNLKGIYLTHVKGNFKCDTFFPKIPRSFKPELLEESKENGLEFKFVFYSASS